MNSKIEKTQILAALESSIDLWKKEGRTGTLILSLNFCDGGFRAVKVMEEQQLKNIDIIEKFSLQSQKIMIGGF